MVSQQKDKQKKVKRFVKNNGFCILPIFQASILYLITEVMIEHVQVRLY